MVATTLLGSAKRVWLVGFDVPPLRYSKQFAGTDGLSVLGTGGLATK